MGPLYVEYVTAAKGILWYNFAEVIDLQKKMWLLLSLLCLALLAGCTTNTTESAKVDYQNISAEQLEEMLADDTVQLIDVREPKEFAEGFIPGAVNIPLGQLESRLQEIDPEKKVIVYCRSGRRSVSAANLLQEKGYKDIYNLQGGIINWGDPLAKPQVSLGTKAA